MHTLVHSVGACTAVTYQTLWLLGTFESHVGKVRTILLELTALWRSSCLHKLIWDLHLPLSPNIHVHKLLLRLSIPVTLPVFQDS